MLDQYGRKKIALISNTAMVFMLFIVGGLTAGKSLVGIDHIHNTDTS